MKLKKNLIKTAEILLENGSVIYTVRLYQVGSIYLIENDEDPYSLLFDDEFSSAVMEFQNLALNLADKILSQTSKLYKGVHAF